MQLGKQIPRDEFNKWIKALRSGKYSQSKGTLHNENGYCCLGVACSILIPKRKREADGSYLYGNFPEDQDNSPEWLNRINNNFKAKTTTSVEYGQSLSFLNDELGYSFNEIADCLELVYVHKALP